MPASTHSLPAPAPGRSRRSRGAAAMRYLGRLPRCPVENTLAPRRLARAHRRWPPTPTPPYALDARARRRPHGLGLGSRGGSLRDGTGLPAGDAVPAEIATAGEEHVERRSRVEERLGRRHGGEAHRPSAAAGGRGLWRSWEEHSNYDGCGSHLAPSEPPSSPTAVIRSSSRRPASRPASSAGFTMVRQRRADEGRGLDVVVSATSPGTLARGRGSHPRPTSPSGCGRPRSAARGRAGGASPLPHRRGPTGRHAPAPAGTAAGRSLSEGTPRAAWRMSRPPSGPRWSADRVRPMRCSGGEIRPVLISSVVTTLSGDTWRERDELGTPASRAAPGCYHPRGGRIGDYAVDLPVAQVLDEPQLGVAVGTADEGVRIALRGRRRLRLVAGVAELCFGSGSADRV